MNSIERMLTTHPQFINDTKKDALISCIQSCFDCGQACVTCSDACLGEKNVEKLKDTIRATADCGDICLATGKILSRLNSPDWNVIKAQVNSCLTIVRQCGMLCNEHRSHHEHCGICADLCRSCEIACTNYLKLLP